MEAITGDAQSVTIRSLANVETSRRLVARFGRELQFDDVSIAELQLIAAELATNVLVHGHGGTMLVERIEDSPLPGIRIEAADAGPGIEDVALATTPGYSSTGSMGKGLSIVQRLSDSCDIRTSPSGTTVTVIKWRAS